MPDDLYRLTTETWVVPFGQQGYEASWTYDGASQILTAEDPQYAYDRLGRITTTDNFPGGTGVPPVGGAAQGPKVVPKVAQASRLCV